MPVALQASPEELLEPRPPNREYVAFCLELQGRRPDDYELETPVMKRLAAIWRGEGTWEERTIAVMEAANREAPGLWRAITSSLVEYHGWADLCARNHVEREQAEIEAGTNKSIAAARSKRLADQWRGHCTGHGTLSRFNTIDSDE